MKGIDLLKKLSFPAILFIAGFFILYSAYANNKEILLVSGDAISKSFSSDYYIAGWMLVASSFLVAVMNIMNFGRGAYIGISVLLVLLTIFVGYRLMHSVTDDIKESRIINQMNTEIKQRMIDNRAALKQYKSEFGKYPENLDELIAWTKEAFVWQVDSEGAVQLDKTITEVITNPKHQRAALKAMGYKSAKDSDGKFRKWNDVDAKKLKTWYETSEEGKMYADQMPPELRNFRRDSSKVPMLDYLYNNDTDRETRKVFGSKIPFNIDSMKVVPFSKGREYWFKSDTMVVTKQDTNKLNVFELKDSEPIILGDTLIMGSLRQPKDNGNWEVQQ